MKTSEMINRKVDAVMQKAWSAFRIYSKFSLKRRKSFLYAIADELEKAGDDLIKTCMEETNLTEARLKNEKVRTVFQLRSYADHCESGDWLDARIDTAIPDRTPPRPDIRKMNVPLGPVVVFGPSNFPFAYSTAGGDTASALAAGCPVIVKAHSAHAGTNELMATAIKRAAEKTGMPDGIFSSLIGEGATLGQQLAANPVIKAIGFTGSYRAGMALYETVTQKRTAPIPLYAEMSSINPVVLLPETLALKTTAIATSLAGSITLGVGQFCTNPGLLFVIKSKATEAFIELMVASLSAVIPATMLNQAICKSYYTDRTKLMNAKGVNLVYKGENLQNEYKGTPALFTVPANEFIASLALQDEVFGPCSLVVICEDKSQLVQALSAMHGQLTGSIYGNEEELIRYTEVVQILQDKTGRVIFNSAPTGVEVCHAMVHGGPFPATTDSRTTSVGTEAIRRFVRPICYQDCPQVLLPLYLQNNNAAGIMRKINGNYTRDAIQ